MLIQPEPAPECRFDFNYKMNGKDWVCNCNIGLQQSPVALPDGDAYDPEKENMNF